MTVTCTTRVYVQAVSFLKFMFLPLVAILFSSSEVFVREGEAVGIQLEALGEFYQNFTVNLMFVNGTAGKHPWVIWHALWHKHERN